MEIILTDGTSFEALKMLENENDAFEIESNQLKLLCKLI